MHELRAIFHGRVQSVGFRATTEHFARKLSLNGFVRNCPDGTVEVVAQGAKDKLEEIVTQLKAIFHIEKIDIVFVKPAKIYEGFSAIG